MPYVPSEFVYEHDFDNNGAMFYLGTFGYQAGWRNPDSVAKQVSTFGSSLFSGRPEDLLGRRATVCLTQD